jgi:hypothetical protein
MKFVLLILISLSAFAGDPIIWGPNKAKNVTNELQFQNGLQLLTGALDPSVTAVNASPGSLYFASSGTTYVKQDSGLSTNWLPFGIATTGSLTTINGQSGPNVSIATGSSGTDFNISAGSNIITLNIPTASASNRGLLSTSDWSLFNSKEPSITSGSTSEIWQGDKTWIAKTSLPVSTATQTALDLKQDAATAATDSELAAGLATKEDTITPGTSAQIWQGDKTWIAKTSLPVSTATQTALDLKEDLSNKSTSTSLGTSNTLYPSQGAVKSYVDTGLATKEPAITTLPLSKGGTNKNMTAVAGGVVYTDADSQEVTTAGTSGNVLQSNGSSAPTWVKKSISGKAEASSAVTLEQIVVPNKQLSSVGNNNERRIETGNKNILSNPSFEDFGGIGAGTDWSVAPTGTNALDSVPIDGAYAIKVTTTSQAFELTQDSTLYQAQFADGVQGLASIRVKTSISSTPIYVCSRQAGTIGSTTNGCVQVQANGKWGLYKVPFILGGTSNGISIHSNSVAVSGDIWLDDAFVGAVDLKQDINVVGSTTSFTPTITNATGGITNYTATGKYRQVGDVLEVSGVIKFSAASAAFTDVNIVLPNSYTVDTSKIPSTGVSDFSVGDGAIYDSGLLLLPAKVYYVNTTSMNLRFYKTASGTNPVNVGASDVISNTAPITFGASDTISFNFKVPVTQLSGASSVYTAQNADTDWQSCGHTTSDFTGFGTVTNIETQCKRQGGDLLMKGKFTVGTPTATEARLALKLSNVSLTSKNTSTIPTIQLAGDHTRNTASTTYFRGVTLIEPSVTYITFSQQSSTQNAQTKLNGDAVSGTGSVIAFDARVPINGWDNSNVIIGTFKDVMTSQGSNTADIQSVYFGSGTNCLTACSTGTCSICRQRGTKITSVTFSSTGTYDINGIDGTKYECSGSAFTGGNYGVVIQDLGASTSTKARVLTGAYTTGANAAGAQVVCIGTP